MIKSMLAATMTFALMTGGAFAQGTPPAPGYQQTSPCSAPFHADRSPPWRYTEAARAIRIIS